MDRHFARGRNLPEVEWRMLHVLKDGDLIHRCQALYDAGWTLRAIGEALHPPRSRSTIFRWVHRSRDSHQSTPGLPDPTDPFRNHPLRHRKKPMSPGISSDDRRHIETLAPLARKYRSRLAPGHPAAVANDSLTAICRALHDRGVRIQELADAAGVSHTAMSKRLKGSR